MLQASELKEEINAVVEAIDNVFRIEGDMEEADVEQLHERLLACIDAVNSRLSKCDALLRKGLKSEAIQEAEIAPPVLGLVDDLDSMEAWDAWADYVRQFGIPPQPRLLLEIAGELNLAYSKAQPIDKVLRQHRLYAIARVPLKDRIPTLRDLAAKDSDNPVWQEDLREYETQRLRQIDAEYKAAFKQGELRSLAEILIEVEKSPWSVQPSKQFRDSILDAHQKLRVAEANRKLTSIAQEINNAFSDFNLAQARLTRNQWDQYNEIAQLSDDSDLVSEVAAALQWLDEEDQAEATQVAYQRAVAELDRALDTPNTRRVELERLYAVAERFDEPLPDRTIRRYEERRRTLALGERRRGILVLVTSLVAVMTCAVAVAIFAFFQMRSNEVSAFETALSLLVTDGKLEEAEAMIEKAPAEKTYLLSNGGIQKLIAQVEKMRSDDDARRARLSQYLESVIKMYSYEPTLEKVRRAAQQLREAEGSVRLESEMTELKRVEFELRSVENTLQSDLNARFRESFAALTEEASRLDGRTKKQVEDLLAQIVLLKQPSLVSPEVIQQSNIDLLERKVKDFLENMNLGEQVAEAEKRLVSNIGNIELYRLALENYRKIDPDSARSSDFKAVLEQLDVFKSFLLAWEKFRMRWNALNIFDDFSKSAKEGLELIAEMKKLFNDLPFCPDVMGLQSHLNAIAGRGPVGDEPITAVQQYLSGKLFKLKLITVQRGNDRQLFYIDALPADNKGGGKKIYPLESPQVLFAKTSEIISVAEERQGAVPKAAPHALLANEVAEGFKKTDLGYEAKICVALHKIANDKAADPIARGLMMLKIAELTFSGSWTLTTEMAAYKRKLDAMANYQNTNWFNNSAETVRDRKFASQDLEELAEVPRTIFQKEIQPALRDLESRKSALGAIKWVGILLKGEGGAVWTCPLLTGPASNSDGMLYIRFPKGRNMETVPIGRIASGDVKLDWTNESQFKEGQPVWLYESP